MIEQKNLVDQELVGTKLELVKKPNKKNSLQKTQNFKILNKNKYIHVYPYESKPFIHKYAKSLIYIASNSAHNHNNT